MTAIEKRLVQAHADQTAREDAAFHAQQQEKFNRGFAAYLSVKDKIKRGRVESVRQELSQWKFDFRGFPVHSYGLYALPHVTTYVPFLANPSAQQVLASYYTARFAPPWREIFPKSAQFLPPILGHLQGLRDQNVRQRKKEQEYVERCWAGYKNEPYVIKGHLSFREYKPIKYAWHSFEICFQENPP